MEVDKMYEEAHHDYEMRKNEILTKLYCIKTSGLISNEVMQLWIDQAMEFIKEREI